MADHVEVFQKDGLEVVRLDAGPLSIGSDASNDIVVRLDRRASRVHAVLERYRAGWSIRDVGSRNGTFVNGEQIWGERILRNGDEVTLGGTRIVYRAGRGAARTATEAGEAPPDLTPRQREVLVALCRPVLGGNVFTEPATIRDIAAEMVVTEAAVKQLLLRLYDKFRIHEGAESRRLRLANDAIRRGAVTLADLTRSPGSR